MSNKIVLKKSSVGSKVPTTSDLDYGEVALNYADGKLYFKNSSNTIQPLGISYAKVIADTTAKINQGYIANTGAGSFTITLPANPQTGNYVIIVDDGNFNANPLYVARNGQPIVGVSQDLTLNIQGVSVTLLYDGGQWNVYTQVGATGGSGSGLEGQEYNYNSFPSAIIPDTNNTYALGNGSYGWSKVWFGDGTGQITAAIADGTSITNTGGTITAQAGGLAGNTLKSTVINSNLTSVGTITSGVWHGSAIANAYLVNSSVTVNGSAISLGGSGTITAVNPNSLTIGTGLSGTTYNGSAGVTIAIDSTVATLSGTQTLTNKSISGSTNTITAIPNSALTNSSVTVGTTAISLGASSTTLAGLTSVTSTSFVGALTGNASTATTLATPRAINGTNFDGSAAITITAANPNALTIGTGLSGTSYTGSAAVTIAIDSTVTTLTGTQTLTNKTLTTPTINGAALSGTFSGTPTFSGLVTLNYTGAGSTSTLNLAGYNSKGGTGYHDFLIATNGYGSATNPNKWFRLNSTGSLEIVNSAYTSTIFTLDDSGNQTLTGNLTVNGTAGVMMPNRPAFRVVGAGTTNISATTTLTSSNFAVDYQQGSALNTSTGIFTAPVAGLYQVNLIARYAGSANMSAIQVQKTSGGITSTQVYLEWAGNSTANHFGGSAVVKMATNDTLKVVVTAGTVTFDGNDCWSVAYIG